jgi:glycosyltransferase involved in cell wall biosynthesis
MSNLINEIHYLIPSDSTITYSKELALNNTYDDTILRIKEFQGKNTNAVVTFIIPTIGRKSLIDSIKSIQNQSLNNWEIIIIFDGVESNIIIDDDRIKIIEIEKKGINKNSAGLVRNEGMKYVNTKWIAFLDDDDFLKNDYIEKFYEELSINNFDVLIFRMFNGKNILPKLNSTNFYIGEVGISFLIKKEIFDDNIIFIPSHVEDFLYLDKMRNLGKRIVISPFVEYFVNKDYKNINFDNGKRSIIDYTINKIY